MTSAPALTSLSGDPAAIRLSERDAGKKVSATFRYQSEALTFDVVWSAILRDGNCNVQQKFDITPVSGSFNMKYAKLIDVTLPDAVVVGKDNGQTVVAGNVFMGIENPMAVAAVNGNRVSIQMEKADEVISVGKTLHYTQSIGVVPEGQLRRGFLYYIQRERVHYRRPVLHYVSWFDMVGGFNGPQNEQNAMDRINIIGKEMVTDRGVKWDSFLLDDNWDDPAAQPVWNLHPTNFPNQFQNLKAATEGYGFQMGAWFSPFGGYEANSATRRNSNPDMERGSNGFSLSGPKYNEAVRNMTFDMVDKQGVNLFKIDGIGGGLHTPGPTQANRKDYEALLQLLLDIRVHRPDYTVYVTVGTWSSPYWYWYADAIWRDGDDTPKVPVGNARQQVLTGRDSFVYSLNVKENILHPIAELSAGGFTFSLKNVNGGSGDIDLSNLQTRKETKDDMRWFFASGYSLQEMPIAVTDIDKMAAADKGFFWDNLAEYAKWSRNNIDLLSDSHMVGDPTALEVYGYASWSPSKGVLALRNPNAMSQTYTVNPRAVFDMPTQMAAPWTFTEIDGLGGEGNVTFTASTSAPFTVTVEPFSVLVYEAVPGATVDTNLALNRPVTDNGTDTTNGFTKAGAVDGQVTTTNSNAWSNDGDAKAKDLWVMVALDDPTLISAVNVNWGGGNYTPNNYQVQVSMTGQEGTFTTAYTQTGKPTEMSNNIHTLTTPMVAKFVRLYMPQDAGATHTGFLMREMEVIGHIADIPTPPPAETINLARGKTVTASSTATQYGYALTGAVDGLTTEGNVGKNHAWSNNDNSRTGNVWVMVELDKISPISQVKIQWDDPKFTPAKYAVQVSTTGEENSFTTMHTQNAKPAKGWVTHEFKQTNAKFVRIYMPQDADASWNAYLMQELEVMGAADSVPDAPKYNLTVTNGVGSGSFQAGATVTVSANTSSGKLFTGWTANGITLSNEQKITNPMTFTMPANHVTLTATYEAIPTFSVTVTGGIGGGEYTESATVTVTATVPSGKRFVNWTTEDGVVFANANAETTTFSMPAKAVIVTANFEAIQEPPILEVVNLALNKTVTASSTDTTNGYAAAGAVDGLTTVENGGKDHAWSNNGDSKTSDVWVMVKLDKISPISQVKIQWDAPILSPTQYEVQVSTTGEEHSFTTMHTQNAKPAMGWVTHEFQQTNAKFVRIYMPLNANASHTAYLMQELEVMGTADSVPDAPKYNVTVTGGTGGGEYAEGATVTITAGAAAQGKVFATWTTSDGVVFTDATSAITTFVMPAKAVTVTASYRDETVTPPTNPGTVTPPTPKPQPPKTEGGTTTVTTQVKPVIKGDTATAEVSAKTISDAIASAAKTAEQNSTAATVEVNVTATDSAKNVEVTLEKSSMTNLADGKNTQLLVSSAVASILFDSSALADIAGASTGDVKISAAVVDVQSLTPAQQQLAKNRPVFDFSIQSGGKDVAFEGGTAQVTVPYVLQEGERAEFVTVWYLDNAGKLIPVAGKYENGSVTCSVTHFSNYAVGYLPFVDVVHDWSYEGIVYAYNNRLFSGTGKDNFAPTDNMTRAMLWSVLYRLAGSPNKTEDTVWYADAQKWAMDENISDGTNPTGNITRQELTVILYRFAKAQPCEAAISLFTDVEEVSDWALDAVNWAVKTGLLHGSDGQLNPLHTASRAQVAAILQRFASLK
ncbi:MAG: discoidin domain-containing protein [Oscillospiraceae bacterium]